jgi:AcrR family transcriptional regulator
MTMADETTEAFASKQAVLEAAHHLILQHGYAGLSMRELARASGLAKGTIYHHFQDKRDIYLHVLERDIQIVCQHVAAAAASSDHWREQLRAIVRAYFQLQRERCFLILVSLREAVGMEQQLCQLVRRYRKELLKPIAQVLERGMAQGEVRSIHMEMAVLSLVGILHSFVLHHMILQELEVDDEAIIDHTLQLFLYGITHNSTPNGTNLPASPGQSVVDQHP